MFSTSIIPYLSMYVLSFSGFLSKEADCDGFDVRPSAYS